MSNIVRINANDKLKDPMKTKSVRDKSEERDTERNNLSS